MSIQKKITAFKLPVRLIIILTVFLPVILIWIFYSYETYKSETKDIVAKRIATAELASKLLHERLDNLTDIGIALAERPKVIEYININDYSHAIDYLKNVLSSFPIVKGLFIADTNGILKAGYPDFDNLIGKNFADRDWYKGTIKEWTPYVSEIYQAQVTNSASTVAVAIPVRLDSDQVINEKNISEKRGIIGILVLHIKLNTFFSGWVKSVDSGKDGFVYIVDQYGHLIYHPKYQTQNEIIDYTEAPSVKKLHSDRQGCSIHYNPIEHKKFLSAYKLVGKYGWGVVVSQPADIAFEERSMNVIMNIVLGILFLTILSFLSLLFFRYFNLKEMSEKQLIKSEARYKSYIDVTGQIAWNTDPNGKIIEDIPSFRQFTGQTYDEVKGDGWHTSIHPDDINRVIEAWNNAVLNRSSIEIEYRMKRADGVYRDLFVRGFPVFNSNHKTREWVGTCIDITDRKKEIEEKNNLERMLMQSQKMETLGEIVGGICHDLKNVLNVINGYSNMCLDIHYNANEKTEYLNKINELVIKGTGILNQNLNYLKPGDISFAPIDILAIINQTLSLMKAYLSNKTAVSVVAVPDRYLPVSGNSVQILQVFMNLLTNACDAMAGKYGQIQITIDEVTFGKDKTPPKELNEGRYLKTCVRDNGKGMTTEELEKVFNTFYTTKKEAGTGLGLSIVKRIMKKHNGTITIDSKIGEGTTFCLYFPVNGSMKY